jgi:multidrug resistance efflux pump
VALEFERMQLDWMSHRVDRAALNGRLQQAEIDLSRAEPLFKAGLLSDENFTQLKIGRDSLKSQLEEKNKLVGQLEPLLQAFVASDSPATALSGEPALAAALKVQEAKLRLAEEQLAPVPLVAPFDGVVTVVLRRAGETVMAGDPVLRLTSAKTDRLAGYLRQPLAFTPKVGMVAQIRTRGSAPKSASTKITQVGAALEAIPATVVAAMRLPPNTAIETGLRVEFAVPAGMDLKPGEHVDVSVR